MTTFSVDPFLPKPPLDATRYDVELNVRLNELFAQIQQVVGPAGGGSGSIANSDGTLTISPTTGTVIASLNLAHANTWTGQQTFSTSPPIFSTMTQGSVLFAGASGVLSQDNANLFWDDTNNFLGLGTNAPAALVHLLGTNPTLRIETTSTSASPTGPGTYISSYNTTGLMGIIGAHTSGYSNPGTIFKANQYTIECYGVGGMVIDAWGAGGDIVFATANGGASAVERFKIAAAGQITLATYPAITTGTSGRIPYVGASGQLTDTANLQWDNSNVRLGVGTAPSAPLHIHGSANGGVFTYLRNASSGGAAYAAHFVCNDDASFSKYLGLFHTSTGYTPSGVLTADCSLINDPTGDINIVCTAAKSVVIATAGFATTNERFRVDGAGNVKLGNPVALATTATNGFAYIPGGNGIPTGVPASLPAGQYPLYVNTAGAAGSRLYAYVGGAWGLA